jgi:phospholipid/cholesterol/gamma-HCH transport system substrate-binding protein
VRIAVLGMIAIAAFGGLFLYVTNRSLSMSRLDVYVRMPVASGLRKGDPVLFRGVQVGEVKKIVFTEVGEVLVLAKLTEKVPLTTDGHAELVAVDLFGRQSLVLKDGTRFAPALESNDTIPGVQPPSMTAKLTDLGGRAERMLSDTMVLLLHETLAGSAAATRQVALLGTSLNRMIGAQHENVTALTTEAASVARNLNAVTAPAEIEATRGNLSRATARLDSATIMLASILGGVERGEGSAGKLLRDEALHDRAESLLTSLEELVRDVKANPKRYINVKVF